MRRTDDRRVRGCRDGLIKEADGSVLTDILGTEDALGDMDFKVAGTRQGVTSIQMDIKIMGLDFKIIAEALEKAKQARLHILDIMDQVMPKPRSELSKYAPRIITIQIRPDKIGDLIAPRARPFGASRSRRAPRSTWTTTACYDFGGGKAASGARHGPGAGAGARGGKVYEGVVKEHHGLRRVHRDPAGRRRAAPHLGTAARRDRAHGGRREEGRHVRVKLLEVTSAAACGCPGKPCSTSRRRRPARSH